MSNLHAPDIIASRQNIARLIAKDVIKEFRSRKGLRQELDEITNINPDIFDLDDNGQYVGDLVDELEAIVYQRLP